MIIIAFFFGVPIAALIYFVASLVKFIKRDKNDAGQCGERKKNLIISSVIFVTFTVAWTVYMIIMISELSHM